MRWESSPFVPNEGADELTEHQTGIFATAVGGDHVCRCVSAVEVRHGH
jgi:hypothetical protein